MQQDSFLHKLEEHELCNKVKQHPTRYLQIVAVPDLIQISIQNNSVSH